MDIFSPDVLDLISALIGFGSVFFLAVGTVAIAVGAFDD